MDNPDIATVYPWLFRTVCGIIDCPTVPGMDSAIGVLLGEMDCEENVFTGVECEAVTFRDGLDVPCIYIVPVGV